MINPIQWPAKTISPAELLYSVLPHYTAEQLTMMIRTSSLSNATRSLEKATDSWRRLEQVWSSLLGTPPRLPNNLYGQTRRVTFPAVIQRLEKHWPSGIEAIAALKQIAEFLSALEEITGSMYIALNNMRLHYEEVYNGVVPLGTIQENLDQINKTRSVRKREEFIARDREFYIQNCTAIYSYSLKAAEEISRVQARFHEMPLPPRLFKSPGKRS